LVGIAGVGELVHIPLWVSVPLVTLLLVGLGLTGSYRRVERIGIAVGLLELCFLPAAWLARLDWPYLAAGLTSLPIMQGNFVFLLAANVGAVIMPWMVFYQQGAVIDKQLQRGHLPIARWDTVIGAILTQLIMIAVVIVTAATIGQAHPGASVQSIQVIAAAFEPMAGHGWARVLSGLGMLGAGFLAALVVSVAGAWGIGEAPGMKHSLNLPIRQARGFYTIYTLAHVGGAALVLAGGPLVSLTLDMEVMNALLLPIVLGVSLALERVALPPEDRMKGAYQWATWGMAGLIMLFGLYMAATMLAQAFLP
jgi:Mn2+/Fe2+ NRAMP family transporter